MQRVDTEICLFSKVYSISVEKPQKESAPGETDLRKLFSFSAVYCTVIDTAFCCAVILQMFALIH